MAGIECHYLFFNSLMEHTLLVDHWTHQFEYGMLTLVSVYILLWAINHLQVEWN